MAFLSNKKKPCTIKKYDKIMTTDTLKAEKQ